MTSPYSLLIATCEQIANDPQLPGFVTDWADDLYARMVDREALILSEDVLLLSAFATDRHTGLFAIDAALARRR